MRRCEGNFGKHGGTQHTRFIAPIVGSSPTDETNFFCVYCQSGQTARLGSERSQVRILPHRPKHHADVAQLVEQRIENPCVTGSNPVFGTKQFMGTVLGYGWGLHPQCLVEFDSHGLHQSIHCRLGARVGAHPEETVRFRSIWLLGFDSQDSGPFSCVVSLTVKSNVANV